MPYKDKERARAYCREQMRKRRLNPELRKIDLERVKSYQKRNREKVLLKHKERYWKDIKKTRKKKKEYYQKNKDKILLMKKIRREKYSEKTKSYRRKYYLEHKTEELAYNKEYTKKHPEKVKEWSHRCYFNKNLHKAKPFNPIYKSHTREYNLERQRIWRKKNRDKINSWEQKRRRNDINHVLAKSLRSRIWRAIKGQKKCHHSIELLGCSIKFFKMYLEKKFKKGMTWKNYGSEWHIDHIIPCAHFNFLIDEDQKRCFHYLNTQPLWKEENWRKNKIIR